MGEYADMIIEGDACQSCGVPITGYGYPRNCKACESEDRDYQKTRARANQKKKLAKNKKADSN